MARYRRGETGRKADDQMHRPCRIVYRQCDTRHSRDLRPAKWASMIICAANPERSLSALGLGFDSDNMLAGQDWGV